MSRLPPQPDLDWSSPAGPRARSFDDIYFSIDGGLAESEAVFLQGCGLPQAWQGKHRFAVGELGFGTGLNALAVWRAWKKTREPHAILHMCSIEAFPLEVGDAARALSAFPEIAGLAEKLLARWPLRTYAPQRIWFPEDGFALTIFIDDAARALAGMKCAFDAWFLDGFAPARNPDMWSEKLFARIAELSAPGARLATYSVAGAVRRGLESNGFAIERKPGFGAKRERLEAKFAAETKAHGPAPKRVAIIGAGLAGAAAAAALKRRSVECVVIEAAPDIAAGASGNPAGLLAPRLDRGDTPARELFLAAYIEACAAYAAMGQDVFTPLRIDQSPRESDAASLADLAADPPLPTDWMCAAEQGGLSFFSGGLVDPRAAITAWLEGAELKLNTEITSIQKQNDHWRLRSADGAACAEADAVILACGPALAHFAPSLPIEITSGQLEWGAGALLDRALMRGSYLAPFNDGIIFGATFDRVASQTQAKISADARARNLKALAELAPDLRVDEASLKSRAALRAAFADRMPVAGFSSEGAYLLGGFGARGLALAPLLGEMAASDLCGEPPMLSLRTRAAISPQRFAERARRKG